MDRVEASYTNLFRNLPPAVSERLQQKYEADRAAFISYVQEATPSSEPKYWANRSCTKCYGRGILGELTKPNGEKSTPACSCTEKNYRKWLAQARYEFNLKKEKGQHEEQTGSPQTAD